MNNKKLIIFLGSMGRGGAERVVSYISDYFSKKGWKVYIVLLLFNKVEYALNENVEVIDLTGWETSRVRRIPYWVAGIRQLVKQYKPDSIISFAARINVIVQMSCLGLKKSIIVSERNDPYMDGRTRIVDMLTHVLYPKAHKIVFQTQKAESYFSKLALKNSVIIPNPISVNAKRCEVTKNKIVTVGRLTNQKNQIMLINAFSAIHPKFPQYRLHIYGDGELYSELKGRVRQLKLDNSIVFEGNIQNVHEMISDAEMFVLPSNYEGLSNALLEAMIMGIPCISTRCAGSDEYIVDAENGLLIDIGDEKGLKNAILKFIENKPLRDVCGKKAQNIIERVSTDVVLEKWYRIASGKGTVKHE